MTNLKFKEILNNIKKKWFIYFLILILVALVWGLYYGRLVETPSNKVLYVWITPAEINRQPDMTDDDVEQLETGLEVSEQQINLIMQTFEENYSQFGFTKYKTQMQSLSNDEELYSYNVFNQFDGDLSILPIDYFVDYSQPEEIKTFTQLKDLSDIQLSQQENLTYIKGLNYYGEQIKVAIKLNDHYALAVSINATAPEGAIENLLNLVLDII